MCTMFLSSITSVVFVCISCLFIVLVVDTSCRLITNEENDDEVQVKNETIH